MTKIQMPEPVASRFIEKNHYAAGKNWVYCEPFNTQQVWTKKSQNDYYVMQLYSAFQMEAYADARVRGALEALNNQAHELYESSLKSRLTRDGAADEDELEAIDLWNVESVGMAKAYTNMQKAIRALIPKEE